MPRRAITVIYVNSDGSSEEEWEVPVDSSVPIEDLLASKDDLINVLRTAGAQLPETREYTLDVAGSVDDFKLRLRSGAEQGKYGPARRKKP